MKSSISTTPSNPLDAYARDVVAGAVPAGTYHKLACARHLRDRAREGTPDFPYRFDLAKADKLVRFAGKLKHYRGEWAGHYITLEPHQQFRLGSLFAWIHVATGLRRFRTAYNEIPRKNGKTLEAAIVALYTTFFTGEPGAAGFFIATKREQSKIAFGDARQLVLSSGLKSRIAVQAANMHIDATASKLEPLGADYDSTDGLSPSFICVDEMHAMKDRGMLDVMETATGARLQPLIFEITTAGTDPLSPCGVQHDYACKILDRVVADESFFVFIAHADDGDDPFDERTWRKANPNWNVSVKPDDMRALALKAKSMPSALGTLKQKRLNCWVADAHPCLSIEGWRNGQSDWTEADMEHEPCYVGVDLASKIDLCALSFVFPPTVGRPQWRLIQRIWTPAETLADRAHRDRAPYQVWVDQGWLIAVPGTSIDHDVVRQAILAARDRYDIQQIGFDPWHADAPIKQLIALDGFADTQVIAVPQTYAGMSAACLQLQAAILAGEVDARRCPVTAWAVSNAVAQMDGKDNMQLIKRKSRGRIDPIVAAAVGISLAIRRPVEQPFTGVVRNLNEFL